jgi:hypothetical protein
MRKEAMRGKKRLEEVRTQLLEKLEAIENQHSKVFARDAQLARIVSNM